MKHPHFTASRFIVLAMLASLWLITPAEATTVELKMTNGRVIRGSLVSESPQVVTISIAGIHSRFDRAKIQSIKRFDSVAQEYKKQRDALENDDLEGRYKLVSWLYYKKQAYTLAIKELQSLKADFPDDPRIPLLLKVVKNKQSLQATPASKAPTVSRKQPTPKKVFTKPTKTITSKPNSTSRVKQKFTTPLLSDEQINLLKVWEVNFSNRPRIVFKPKDLRDFLEQYAGQDKVPSTTRSKKQFLNQLKGYQQLRVLFDAKARDYYPKAKIVKDPEVFQQFKAIHRKYILNRCATNDCHGNPEAPGIVLFNKASGRHPAPLAYTNFYILSQYKTTRNGKIFDMIDRESPERSLLLQFGLATGDAEFPHPSVRSRTGPAPFKGKNDLFYRQIHGWISSLLSPAPDYGIDYEVPQNTPPSTPIPNTLKR